MGKKEQNQAMAIELFLSLGELLSIFRKTNMEGPTKSTKIASLKIKTNFFHIQPTIKVQNFYPQLLTIL